MGDSWRFRKFAGPNSRKHRHHDEPSVGKLIVANHGVAAVSRVAHTAKTLEDRVRRHGSVNHCSGLVVLLAFLRVHRDTRVHDLKDVVWADCQAAVGGAAKHPRSLRTHKSLTKSVEAFHQRYRRTRTLGCLLHCGALRRDHGRWHGLFRLLLLILIDVWIGVSVFIGVARRRPAGRALAIDIVCFAVVAAQSRQRRRNVEFRRPMDDHGLNRHSFGTLR